MVKTLRFMAIVLVSLSLSACMTLATQVAIPFNPEACDHVWLPNLYSGVFMDVQGITHYGCTRSGNCEFGYYKATNNFEFFLLVDAPLSFALDTALLPVTIFKQIKYGNLCSYIPQTWLLSTNVALMLGQTATLKVQVYEAGSLLHEYMVVKEDERYKKLIQWAGKNSSGWLKNPDTYEYVSGVLVSGGGLNINFLDTSVILNDPNGQFTKDITPADYAFLK